MDHLLARFRLLVDAIRNDHSFHEIATLADAVWATAFRIKQQDDSTGISNYLMYIMRNTQHIKRLVEHHMEDKPTLLMLTGLRHLSNTYPDKYTMGKYSQINPRFRRQLNGPLREIQKNIQKIAERLKIKLEEINLELEEVTT